VNIYGSRWMSEHVGKFFGLVEIHLQDPVFCCRDVSYENPQVFAQSDEIVMTSSFGKAPENEAFVAPEDIFDQLLRTSELPQAETPRAVRTKMYRYYLLLREPSRNSQFQSSKTSFVLHAAKRKGIHT